MKGSRCKRDHYKTPKNVRIELRIHNGKTWEIHHCRRCDALRKSIANSARSVEKAKIKN